MYLRDSLQVCLYGFMSRYPDHRIDVLPAFTEIHDIDQVGWQADELIEELAKQHPEALKKHVWMNIECCDCAIYIEESTTCTPILQLHCFGRLPAYHEHSHSTKVSDQKAKERVHQ